MNLGYFTVSSNAKSPTVRLLLVLVAVGTPASQAAGPSDLAGADQAQSAHERLGTAIRLSADYLIRACGADGRFVYQIDPDSGRASASYNIVRHAGAIYALDMYNRTYVDAGSVSAMRRAAEYMQTRYISSQMQPDVSIIWTKPLPLKSEASLGAAGLGLTALTAAERSDHAVISTAQLTGIARFVTFLQRPDGSFASRYRAESGPESDWESLYYPGEAALGLISLYETTGSKEWLIAAGMALSHLARSRVGVRNLPPDHWALIATAKFLPHYSESSCPSSRAELVEHAARLSAMFVDQQIWNAVDNRLNGGFDRGGRTTPTAIRLEGLLAALEALPKSDEALRTRIGEVVQRGVDFLERAQITSGPYAGGIPGSVIKSPVGGAGAAAIRIDYVQHALCAWLGYEQMLARIKRGGRS